MADLAELEKLGQSIWLDFIHRSLLDRGGLETLISKGVRGVTSNPTILEKAIAGTDYYDSVIAELAKKGLGPAEIYEELACEDIRRAADVLNPVFEASGGLDGYVSLEVSPAHADSTDKTIMEALRLVEKVGRRNLMIKIPATAKGYMAMSELIARGISVNATLIFSIDQYLKAVNAYLNGLRAMFALNPDAENLPASVASFFVSRIDSAVDPLLVKAGHPELAGKTAIANAKMAYVEMKRIYSSREWVELKKKGSRVQRLLWASTKTKNPDYPDTLYIDGLIGKNTVNTVPPDTLEAFLDHGLIASSLERNLTLALENLERLAVLDIDLDEICGKLLDEGLKSFAGSFDSLLAKIGEKSRDLLK